MSEARAKQFGLKPKAYLRDFVYKSQDPIDQLLLSPADCIAHILKKAGLKIQDIDVWELHEAFAVCACQADFLLVILLKILMNCFLVCRVKF